MAGFTPGQAFLGALLNSKDQKGVSFGDNMLMAHVSPDGGPHSGGPEHDFMHGRRGSGTWGDGTSKTEPRFNQDGRTFADGTPLTSKNYEDFQINPNVAPGLYNPFEGQFVNGVPRTPANSSIQQDPSGPYNPFEGQFIIDQFGNKVPRTPTNSVPGP